MERRAVFRNAVLRRLEVERLVLLAMHHPDDIRFQVGISIGPVMMVGDIAADNLAVVPQREHILRQRRLEISPRRTRPLPRGFFTKRRQRERRRTCQTNYL